MQEGGAGKFRLMSGSMRSGDDGERGGVRVNGCAEGDSWAGDKGHAGELEEEKQLEKQWVIPKKVGERLQNNVRCKVSMTTIYLLTNSLLSM